MLLDGNDNSTIKDSSKSDLNKMFKILMTD